MYISSIYINYLSSPSPSSFPLPPSPSRLGPPPSSRSGLAASSGCSRSPKIFQVLKLSVFKWSSSGHLETIK